MPTLKLLDDFQRKNFDAAPKLTEKQRTRYFVVNGELGDYVNNMRGTINQVVFLLQLAYFRASGKFFPNASFRTIDIKYACSVLEIYFDDIAKNIGNYSFRSRSAHKNYILVGKNILNSVRFSYVGKYPLKYHKSTMEFSDSVSTRSRLRR